MLVENIKNIKTIIWKICLYYLAMERSWLKNNICFRIKRGEIDSLILL